METNARQKQLIRFYTFYIFIYSGIGVLFPLIGQYLTEVGFSGTQIGQITAAATAVGIFASPFWGAVYHRSGNNRRITLLLCVAMAASALVLMPVRGYWIFMAGYVILHFFQAPICPLADSMTLEEGFGFGAVRKWGAVGYALGSFAAAQLAVRAGLGSIFPLVAGSFLIAALLVKVIVKHSSDAASGAGADRIAQSNPADQQDLSNRRKQVDQHDRRDQDNRTGHLARTDQKNRTVHTGEGTALLPEQFQDPQYGYKELVRNRKFIVILICAASIVGTNMASNTYFGFLYTEGGGTLAGIGTVFLLMVGSEAVFMAGTETVSRIFTLERTILIAMVISALRFFWYSSEPAPWLLTGTFFLQGIVNGVTLVEFVKYIEKVVHPAMLAVAITLFQAIAANGSQVLSQLLGGYLLEYYGGAAVYFGFAVINTVGVFLYICFGLFKPTPA